MQRIPLYTPAGKSTPAGTAQSPLSGKRVLFMPSSVGVSHLCRLLLIAESVRQRGAEVAFAYGGRHTDLLSTNEFPCFRVTDIDIGDFSANVFAAYTERIVRASIRDQLRGIEEFSPHLLVADFQPTASITARISRLPLVAVVNACLTDYFDVTDLYIRRQLSPVGYQIANPIVRGILYVQKRSLAFTFRTVARHHGVRDMASIYDFFRGDLNLIPDVPEFCPLREAPDNYHYIGPLIWEQSRHRSGEVQESLDSKRPLIYATIGNTGNPEMLDRAVRAFAPQEEFQVVITTGAYVAPASYEGHRLIHACRFLPGSEVIRRSTVIIHSGGSGTTYQCLAHGRPAVVIPCNNEQRINARLLQRHCLGVAFRLESLSSDRLFAACKMVAANGRISAAVGRFQKLIDAEGSPSRAAVIVEEFLAGRAGDLDSSYRAMSGGRAIASVD